MPENRTLRVLLVEDSEDDAALLLREIKRQYPALTYQRVETQAALEAALAGGEWDIVISDHSLPHFSGPDALRIVRERLGDLPFIIVSGTISEDVAVDVMKAGANDYFSKGKLTRLLPAVERELREAVERRERRRMEAQLRQAEQRFVTMFHASPVASSLTVLEDGRLIDVNARFAAMFGYERDELIDRTSVDLKLFVDPRQRDKVVAPLRAGELLNNDEILLRTKDGALLVGLVSLERIEVDDQVCILGMIHDITERKQTESALRRSEQRFRSLMENSYDGIALLDESGHVLYLSPSSRGIVGYEDSELLKRALVSVIHPDDAETVLAYFWDLVAKPGQTEVFNYRLLHKDGSWRWIEAICTNLLHEPAVNAVVANYRDITERKQIEVAIRESERFARSTVNALSAHIAILDENGVIVAMNDAWRNFAQPNNNSGTIHKRGTEGVNYIEVSEAATGPDAEYGWALAYGIRQVLNGNQTTFTLEYPCHSPTERLWFLCRVTRFSGDGPARVVVAHENITEQKVVEKELASLYNATSVLFKAESVDDLGRQVVDVIVSELGKVNCGLLLVDNQTRQAVSVALAGHHRLSVGDSVSLDGRGLIARALRTRQPVYAPDVSREHDYYGADAETKSELVVPLLGARGVLGALDLQSNRFDGFAERDQRIMTAFAERVSSRLETMLLYEEINTYNRELETSVARRTAELHNAKEHVEAILNNSSDAIVVADLQGKIEQANLAFTRMFGQIWDEPFGHDLLLLIEPDYLERLNKVLDEVATTLTPSRIELVCRRADGSTFDADVAIAPVTQYDNAQFSFIYSLRDITVRKQAEENLRLTLARERELNELKTRFTSMVSHEFRNPLAVIQSAGDLVRHYGNRMTDERKAEQLDQISLQVRRLTLLLDDILAVNRAQSRGVELQPRPLDLPEFLGEIVREMRLTAGDHEIELSCTGATMEAVLDPKLLRQALTNLVSNAVKYSPHGGKVSVTAERMPDQVIIRVRDEGIGIPAEDIEHLFEVFHRARNVGGISGSGLGLAIVKQAVDAHNGHISVESTLGEGSQFTLVLPPEVEPGVHMVPVG